MRVVVCVARTRSARRVRAVQVRYREYSIRLTLTKPEQNARGGRLSGQNAFTTAYGCRILTALLGRTKVFESRDKLRTTTEAVAVKGDLSATDEVVGRAGRDRAIAVARYRTTTSVSDARHLHALNFEIGGTRSDYLAAVRCAVA